jgi:hypothetical protein
MFKASMGLQGRSILVQMDNTTVLNYINKAAGTKSPEICQLMWDLFQWCIAPGAFADHSYCRVQQCISRQVVLSISPSHGIEIELSAD